jgi:acetylglutamate kinase
MEPRDKHRTRNVSGGLKKNAVGKHSASSPLYLPNIAELIEEGQITVGVLPKVWCIAATADNGHDNLAMLVRRKGETLAELLTRLDMAIAKAKTEGIFTDEINTP